ncbi:MAG: amidohydrolase family protein [Gallintestinimicrobium sp.]
MVTPNELVSTAARFGTTTFIVDPHEAANVSGAAGIDYILDQTEKSPANVYVMMPSCVPATHVDDNGGIFSANDMYPYVRNPRVLGLGGSDG